MYDLTLKGHADGEVLQVLTVVVLKHFMPMMSRNLKAHLYSYQCKISPKHLKYISPESV